MIPRNRFLSAMRGEPIDRLPTQIDFTPLAAVKAAEWLGAKPGDLHELLGNHFARIGIDYFTRTAGTTRFDIWGVGWDTTINDGFQIDVHPLADLASLCTYRFPDPDDPRLYADVKASIAQNGGRLAIRAGMGFCLWERFYTLRGFEQAMEDLVAEPALVEDLLDRILEVQMRIAKNLLGFGLDLFHTGDDFGSQGGLLFHPDMWRRVFKPRYAKLWGLAKSQGVLVSHHSCGDVRSILDDMIEIGLNVLNPVQTHAMPPDELADRWGDRLGFWGGICIQDVLPFGTPDEVRSHIALLRKTLGRRGRYVIGPSHAMMSDVPKENFFAMLEGMGVRV